MAERFLAGASEPSGPGRPGVELTVLVDEATLTGASEEPCVLDDELAAPAQTARRLACDAALVRMVVGEHGQPLDVGRRTRSIPSAVDRALRSRDKGCRLPGCTNRLADGHHVVHWADGGETSLANLVLLCKRHHRLVHEGGFEVALEAGRPSFFRPDGRHLPAAPAPGGAGPWPPERVRSTPLPHWDGELPDYGMAIDALLDARTPDRSG